MISFSHLNLGIFFLLMTIRTTFSQDTDIEHLSQRVETLSSYIKSHDAVLKQVELSMNTYIFKRDYDKLEEIVTSKLKFIIHSEMKNMTKILREIEDSKDNLAKKQTELDTKLEKILSEVESIKDISKVARNISFEVPYCTDIKDRSVTDISEVARNISLDVAFCKESYTATEKLEALVLKHFKSTEESLKIDLPETMLGHTYFLTPKLNQEDAAKYCKDHGGKPFIPKTKDEFLYYVSMTVDPENNKGSWYPVNDIEEEGHAVLLDGTDYEKASYKLQKWDSKWNNSKEADCVTVDFFGEGSWSSCYNHDFVLLCQRN
ncbi:UNVERIFIED_CONTAM: hypothetical protein RMT77_016701 [Armadillidium vulgare]